MNSESLNPKVPVKRKVFAGFFENGGIGGLACETSDIKNWK